MVFTNMNSFKFWLLYPYWYYYPYEKEYTFEQAEKEYLEYLKSYKNYVPTGEPVSFLEDFKAKKQEGDKLYLYRNAIRYWYKRSGIEQFILARDNKIIDFFYNNEKTRLNSNITYFFVKKNDKKFVSTL